MQRVASYFRHFLITSVLGAMLAPTMASAVTLAWPSPSCSGTLQSCINAAVDGDRIEIATNTPIAEDLDLYNRSLTLTAADGFRPQFAAGHSIRASTASITGGVQVRLSKLRLVGGSVLLTYFGTGTATYDVRELTLTPAPSGGLQPLIRVSSAGAGTVEAMLYDNRVTGVPAGLNAGLVELNARGSKLQASAYYNHVTSTSAGAVDGAGILVNFAAVGSQAAEGTVKLHANEVRGAYSRAGIFVSEGMFAGVPSSVQARLYNNVVVGHAGDQGRGIGLTAMNGAIDAQILNNTITRVGSGISANSWEGATTPEIRGMVRNNLVRAATAMYVTPSITTGLSNDYNLFNGATQNLAPGPNTITAAAGLVDDAQPRLTAASPAVDAADTAALALGLMVNTLPVLDADGLRRLKTLVPGGSVKADIGAYEFGDTSFMHTTTASNISGHISRIDHPSTNDKPVADVFPTPNFSGDGSNPPVEHKHPFGTWYSSNSHWTVFNQNLVTMPQDVDFNVFVPARGSGVFRHVTTAANISGWASRLDDSSLNNRPDMIVLAAQNWSAGPVYNAHPVGVFYFAWGGPGAWHVANLDMVAGQDMPVGAGFSIYTQEPSPNAFRVTARATNTLGKSLILDHPLLNGNPCAQPMVTRVFDGVAVSGHFDAEYLAAQGRWSIYGQGGMPAGKEFHVLVNPAQVAACSERIFADGFE